MSDFHYKIHFPSCGCKYNKHNMYMIDSMDRKTKKYTHVIYKKYIDIKEFIKNNNYSVCIHNNTPEIFLNGGVIFITNSEKSKKYQEDFKSSKEIIDINFYSLDDLKKNIPNIPEYHNFTPIKDSLEVLSNISGKDLNILICKQKDRDDNLVFSFPKGKRMLSELSLECGLREFVEETGIVLESSVLDNCYQSQIREKYRIAIPRTVRIFNCLFQIIIL